MIRISIDEKKLKEMCFDVIRRETSNFERETSDAELGNFVRGVVALEIELYSDATNTKAEED